MHTMPDETLPRTDGEPEDALAWAALIELALRALARLRRRR